MIRSSFMHRRHVTGGWSWLAMFALLACASPLMADGLPASRVPDSFGVNVSGIDLTDDDFERMTELNVHWVRRGILWTQVEKEKGEFTWDQADAFVNELEEHGLGLVSPVAFGNTLYEPGQHWIGVRTEAGREGYANYAANLVGRYKDKKIIWEIWNEPNGSFWEPEANADQFMDMVDVAIPRMREADPDCTIVGPSLYNIGWPKAMAWLEVCLQRGLHEKVDGISFHSYAGRNTNSQPELNIQWHQELRALLAKYGAPEDYPIIQSEYGINVQSHEFSGSRIERETQQAQTVTRSYLIMLMLEMPVNIHYEWQSRTKSTRGDKGLINRDGTTAIAYDAFNVLTDLLDGYAVDRRLAGHDADDYILVLTNSDGHTRLAAWTTAEPHEVAIPVNHADAADVWDLLGEKHGVEVEDGMISIQLDHGPTYVGLGAGSVGETAAVDR